MFNLDEFQYSNVLESDTNPIKIKKIKETKAQQQICVQQPQTVNIPVIKNKNKSKKLLAFDPCKTYQKIREWRKLNIAPVDTIGCDQLSQPQMSENIQKYQTLIALMLSVQTTDQITSMVVKRLQEYGLTPQNIAKTPQPKLIELIYQSNFNKRKAKNIIQVSKKILEKGLPKNQQQLLQLPGIGVKIAMIYLRSAQGLVNGIGVDTHVHRISNKLGWVKTNIPNQTQDQLQQLFPKVYWTDINVTLVGFGQILCNAKKPLCAQCPVNLQCPSSLLSNSNKIQW